MAIDLLSLIGTVYRDRLGRAELAQRAQDSAADRALRESMQGREFDFQGKESAADRALRESMQGQQFEFQGRESAAERALREKLEAERLGLTRSANEVNQLSELSQLLGRGATNIPQADVLSMLAQRFGVPVNTAQLRNAGRATEVSPASGSATNAFGHTSWAGAGLKPAATQWDSISGWIEPQGISWRDYLRRSNIDTAPIAMSPTERATRYRRF